MTKKYVPIIIKNNGEERWYRNGLLHREDGPAVIKDNGKKIWYYNSLKHREDGPAVEYADGKKIWYYNSLKHREDGPAYINTNGDREWWYKGKIHREDGPAIIRNPLARNHTMNLISPIEEWWYKGKIHRVNGPAVKYYDGRSEWWINGLKHRINYPSVSYFARGYKNNYWYKYGKKHRMIGDGPAIKFNNYGTNEYKAWHFNGLYHCLNGPAEIFVDGKDIIKCCYIYGKYFDNDTFMQILKRKQRRKMLYYNNKVRMNYKMCSRKIYEDFNFCFK